MAAERELPPLHVKLTGDASSYNAMMSQAIVQAKELEKTLSTAAKKTSGGFLGKLGGVFSGIRNMFSKANSTGAQAAPAAAAQKIESASQAAANATKAAATAAATTTKAAATAAATTTKAAATAAATTTKAAAAAAATATKAAAVAAATATKAAATAAATTTKAAATAAATRIRAGASAMATIMKAAATAAATRIRAAASALATVIKAMAEAPYRGAALMLKAQAVAAGTATRAAASAAATAVKAAAMAAGITRRAAASAAAAQTRAAASAAAAQTRAAAATTRAAAYAAATQTRAAAAAAAATTRAAAYAARMRNRPRSRSGMGDRADVYMHAGALRGMAGMVGSFFRPGVELETTTTQMEVFTKSASKAAEVVQELQKHALISPYNTQALAESSTLLMKYGMSADQSLEMLKHLGEIAGGSAHKLHLVAYAMGQINTAGYLRGQELRQMTEHGFNPLMVMAKETATDKSDAGIKKRYAELDEMMRKRKISAEDVAQAIKVATTEGGDFAGMQDKMSKTTAGLTQQIYENIQAMQNDIYKIFEEDIKSLLRTVLAYVKAFRDWVTNPANRELIKYYAFLTIKILAFVAGLHMAGYAVSRFAWMVATFFGVFGRIGGLFASVFGGIRTLMGALGLLRIGFVATWMTALGPIAAVIAGIAAIGAMIFIIAASLYHPGGFVGAFYDATQAVIGFFWNLSENVTKIMEWSARNWKALIIDVLLALTGVGGLINAAVAYGSGKSIGEHMAGTYDEMGLNLKGPDMSKMLAPPPLKEESFGTMPKYEADWSNLGKGTGKETVEVAKRAKDAVMAGSAEHAVQQWEAMQQVQADTAKEKLPQTKQEKQGDDMVKLLRGIEQNTKPSTKFDETLTSAGLGELA